ncbi:hypothetical protein [Sphingomonas sp. SUN039]|uniref:hypothetical protein n=1 Tax=Sphingomonas sp. SUN039 TaxID=2937787 RepID=UPI002164732F|nr:hypothetical protein [Sphingomonas sp. SUN039]UVO55535.1 hypothetical protein M0209_15935 [Sphingomonas sp. SUN039]
MTIAGNETGELGETFLRMLMSDAVAALDRRETNDSQTARRDLIRTLFAFIEGAVWTYREHIREVAASVHGELPPATQLALAELTYSVSETGRVITQPKYLSLTAMIRMTTNLAGTIAPNLAVDFAGAGWSSLKRAVGIRNRVTHPKSKADLIIEPSDIVATWAAIRWVLGLVEGAMTATVQSQAEYLRELKELADDLRIGNPATLKEYEAVRRTAKD